MGVYRTAALGTQVQQCDRCGHQEIAYRSCRNRHCPKCHGRARDEWLRDRAAKFLWVPYCHVVLTLPHELAPLAFQNPRVVYGNLFRALSPDGQKWITPRKKNFFVPVKPLGHLFRSKFRTALASMDAFENWPTPVTQRFRSLRNQAKGGFAASRARPRLGQLNNRA